MRKKSVAGLIVLLILICIYLLFYIFRQKRFSLSQIIKFADLNNDSFKEEYRLQNGKLTVKQQGKIIWQSDKEWFIDSFVLADSTNDGVIDLNLSVWKPGNFGKSKPFWVEENDQSVKNHFFIFDLRDSQLKPVWQSSNLDKPNCQFSIVDINNDKENELIVIEGEYKKPGECQGKYTAIWKWNGWGFSNQSRKRR